ncbi:MAG: hypothetical protein R2991_10335 [Thermoanaerobaculia bacterium]
MVEKSRSIEVVAATLDVASGEARRLEAIGPRRLSKKKLAKALEDVGMVPKGGSFDLTSHVLLSPQTPWVEGKGYLDALNPRTWFSDGPNISFLPESGQPKGRLDVWLHGLDPDVGYLARIEVGSVGTAPFDVRAVTLGAGLVSQTFQADGGFDSLFLQFSSGDGGLGLLRVECADWSFYEVEVSRMDN